MHVRDIIRNSKRSPHEKTLLLDLPFSIHTVARSSSPKVCCSETIARCADEASKTRNLHAGAGPDDEGPTERRSDARSLRESAR